MEIKNNSENTPQYIFDIANIFENKGKTSSIAEKAIENLTKKRKNLINKNQRIHYFTIGHAFKQIDCKTIFDYVLDEEKQKEIPRKFLSLQLENFIDDEQISKLLNNIRNINNHYVHTLDCLNIQKVTPQVVSFIKQSFELAIIQILIQDKIKNKEEPTLPTDHEIILFLKNIFGKTIDNKSKETAIESVLFIEVEKTFTWKINDEHEIFEIEKGKYLSFEANLFFINLFLYKNEANQLISKIKGYKRNESDEMMRKRNLFTYFSKKYTSQDVDAEENHLIKFRDILQYLNHYPTIWSKELELNSKFPEMTKQLEENIIRIEINRSYPDYANDADFLTFAKNYLFGNDKFRKKIAIANALNQLNSNEKAYFEELTFDPHIKIFKKEIENAVKPISYNKDENAYKIFIKQHVLNTYFENKAGYDQLKNHEFKYLEDKLKYEDDGFVDKLNVNPKTEKLKIRIEKNLLLKSYGRNQDRFMDFAMRFLSEKKYFGHDALIKCYRFRNNFEQDDFLEKHKQTATKKEFDNLKFHRGQLTHFSTFAQHLENYPDWDTPFVTENNAISIQITLNTEVKTIPLQRNLMPYLLEHALFYHENPEGKGKDLLLNYYFSTYKKDFKNKLNILTQEKTIEPEEKTAFKKLFPRRLLHQYSDAVPNYTPEYPSIQHILKQAEKKEKRYSDLLAKAQKEKTKDDFLKRNKGKQYKLQFIRKACHLMFFKETYWAQIGPDGHHKRFHITRDEFNDFSRWMFAFAGNDSYKKYLQNLFEKKGFFDNKEFKKIFDQSNSLESFYNKTKIAFSQWVETATTSKDVTKFSLNNYQKFFNDATFHINVSHFRSYLIESKISTTSVNNPEKIVFKSLENNQYLTPSYYYKETLDASEYKKHINFAKKLNSNRLEDALLYEIAFRHLPHNANFAKTKIEGILTQSIPFSISDNQKKHLYYLTVPFNKIDSYAELLSSKYSSKSATYLTELPQYLTKTRVAKGKDSSGTKLFYGGDLNFADLNTINNQIINEATSFTNVLMAIEEYFILKDKTLLPTNKDYIDNEDIDSLQKFSKIWKIWKNQQPETEKPDVNYRNIACHFNLPLDDSLKNILYKVEEKFIKEEIAKKITHFNDLSKSKAKVCEALLKSIHNNLYLNLYEKNESKKLKNDPKEKDKRVKKVYLEKIINK